MVGQSDRDPMMMLTCGAGRGLAARLLFAVGKEALPQKIAA
jgi:hypothetical protein